MSEKEGVYYAIFFYGVFGQMHAYCTACVDCKEEMELVFRENIRPDDSLFESIKFVCPCCGLEYCWIKQLKKWVARR